ncbi:hypothetical protein EXIGLDRAFT_775765 [Exidia glandulosa HHB12029]|uniref:Uncharacterized protein n=1 Tax=Exidia glandulosa HHB12029 TaxID=1314781 RepID=A0A165DS14_EXIGL|nr:hypothetical protein EXIGLDRAFT_775765 [Exidia glandulosa HHB12029]
MDGRLLLRIHDSHIELWDCNGRITRFESPWPWVKFSAGEISYDGSRLVVVGRCASIITNDDPLYVVGWTMQGTEISADPSFCHELARPEKLRNGLFRVVLDQNSIEIYLTSVDEWGNTHCFVLDQPDLNDGKLRRGSMTPIRRLPNERYALQQDGWITRADEGDGTDPEKLCWIPPTLRSDNPRCVGHMLLSWTQDGEPAVVDLSAFNKD